MSKTFECVRTVDMLKISNKSPQTLLNSLTNHILETERNFTRRIGIKTACRLSNDPVH